LHTDPIRLIKYNKKYEVVFSTDQSGVIEVWDPVTYDFPSESKLSFEFISDTDLFTLVEKDAFALSLEFSPDRELMSIYSSDR
jgi:WD40 repeat protein